MMICRLYRYLHEDLCRRFWPRLLLGLLAFSLLVRLSPYLTPIRAVDLAQDQPAVEFSDRHGLRLGTILTRDQNHTAVVSLTQMGSNIYGVEAAADAVPDSGR